jgi:uncharacterized protein (TIGR02246 family)
MADAVCQLYPIDREDSVKAAIVLCYATLLRLLVASGAGFVLTACSAGITTPAVPPDLKHSWEVAFNRGDSAAVAALYSQDAELVMSGSSTVRGREAIRAAIDNMAKSGVKVRIGAEQNVGSGEIAYVYGHYSVLERDGGRNVESGTYIEVWRRRAGVWQIDLDVNAVGLPTSQ